MGVGERGALKKLKEAALHWARPSKHPAKALTVDEDVAKGLRRIGVSEADIETQRRAREQPELERESFEVHEDCWDSWLFFLQVSRQWQFVPVSNGVSTGAVRQCLNWPGIESMARMSGKRRSLWPALFADLQEIEEAVLVSDAEVLSNQQGR